MNKEVGRFTGNISGRPETRVTKVSTPDVINAEFRYLDDSSTGTQVKTGENKWRTGCLVALGGIGLTAIALGAFAAANPCVFRQDCGARVATHAENRAPITSSATGTPNRVENENLSGFTWKHLNPGESARVNAGDFFMGDGSVDGVFMTDSNENTGAIYNFERSAEIRADFGGDIRTPINPNDKPNLLAEAVDQMLNTGGVGHRGVNIVYLTTFRADGKNIEVPYGRK